MKQSSQRRDPRGAKVPLEAERDAEAKRDAELGKKPAHPVVEVANRGRRTAQIAGGNGEQISRERARAKSEEEGQAQGLGPFPPRINEYEDQTETKIERPSRQWRAEKSVEGSGQKAPSTVKSPERTSEAPPSQSGARISDFE
jgi:hypothetical protein